MQRNWNTAGAAISAAGRARVRRTKFWSGLAGLVITLLTAFSIPIAQADTSLSEFGNPKYLPNFTHFDYANPDAPTNGDLVFANYNVATSFDSLNPFVLRGTAAPGDTPSLLLMFDTLMQRSWDELASSYPLIADSVEVAPDKMSATFHINPKARFSNGDPITAADVKYSYDVLSSKLASPQLNNQFQIIKKATVLDRLTIRFDFNSPDPSAPLIAGDLWVFSPKWGQLPNGKHVPFDQIAMEPVIGSGPYVVDHIDGNQQITYRRLPNYWAKDLPTRRGMYNFDRITFKLYLDLFTRLEAFKANNFDVNVEYSSSAWARKYIGRNFDNGMLKKEFFPLHTLISMQGFVFNTRRPIFQDVRVRKAISLAFDYDWLNREAFYGQYPQTNSFFEDSPFKATGMPSAAELKLLDPWRKYLPPSVFGPMTEPISTVAPHSLRDNLKEARDLLGQAGWHYKDGAMRNANGQPLTFEIINEEPGMERVYSVLIRNLALIGVKMTMRDIDASLYLKRVNNFDYDMISWNYDPAIIPGKEMVLRFASDQANVPGSQNFPGAHSPAIDALLRDVMSATTYDDLLTASHALDRALMHSWYMIPTYYQAGWRIAYASYIGHPKVVPDNYQAEDWIISYWWNNKPDPAAQSGAAH